EGILEALPQSSFGSAVEVEPISAGKLRNVASVRTAVRRIIRNTHAGRGSVVSRRRNGLHVASKGRDRSASITGASGSVVQLALQVMAPEVGIAFQLRRCV